MANTTGLFRAKVTTESTDDAAALVPAQVYDNTQVVSVQLPDTVGPWIDVDGVEYPQNSLQIVVKPSGGTIAAADPITVLEFAQVRGGQGASTEAIPRGTTAEKIALGTVPFNTLFGDETLGQLHKYAPGGDTFNVVAGTKHQLPVMSWPTNSTEGSGLNFKVTEDPDATVGITSLNLPDGTQKQIWIVAQQVVGEAPSAGGAGTLGTAATVRNDAGVISLVSVPNEIRWDNAGSWATLSYNQITHVVVDMMDITTANIQQALQAIGGAWKNIDGTSGVDAAAEWTTDTEYVGPDNKVFTLTVPATIANGPYVTNDGQTLTPGRQYNLKYNLDRSATDSVPAIADDAATVAEILLMDVVGEVGSGSSSVELISRSGSHNPGNGSPFQHATQHGKQGSTTYAAGIYTIGVGGLYDIDASLTLANGTSAGNVSAQIFINDVAEGPIALISNDGVANFPGSGAALISRTLAAGDTVEFRQLTTPGFNVNKATSMRIATRGGPRGADGAVGSPGVDGTDGLDGRGIATSHRSDGVTAIGGTVYTLDHIIYEYTDGTFQDIGLLAAPTPTQQQIGDALIEDRGIFREIHGRFSGADSGTHTFPDGGFGAGFDPIVSGTSMNNGNNIDVDSTSPTQFTYHQWDVETTQQAGDIMYVAKGLKP